MRPTYSGTRLPVVWSALLAVSIAAWWTLLLARPALRDLFRPQSAGDADLLAFLLPDVAVVALSAAAAVALGRGSGWGVPLAWCAAGGMAYSAAYVLAWAVLRDGGWWAVVAMVPAATISALLALDASPEHVRVFRRARRAPSGRHLLATALSIVLFWGFFLGAMPFAIAYVERELGLSAYAFPGQLALGVGLFVAASALGLWSGVTMARRGEGTPLPMDATNALVVEGPYRWIRNPMVVAGLAQGLAVVLALGSRLGLAYVALGALLWQVVVRPAEERELAEKFGPAYEAYRARVRCWIPRRP